MKSISFKAGGLFHPIKNLYLRWRYGAGCCDVFTLYPYLAKKILPPIKRFRHGKKLPSYPTDFKSVEEWEKVLDEMIWALEYSLTDELCETAEEAMRNAKRQQEGLELFGKHFRNLWI